eukprot:gene24286-biopygen7386
MDGWAGGWADGGRRELTGISGAPPGAQIGVSHLAPRVRPHPPRGLGARRGRMGPEVGPAFQRRSQITCFSRLGVRGSRTMSGVYRGEGGYVASQTLVEEQHHTIAGAMMWCGNRTQSPGSKKQHDTRVPPKDCGVQR